MPQNLALAALYEALYLEIKEKIASSFRSARLHRVIDNSAPLLGASLLRKKNRKMEEKKSFSNPLIR